MARMVFNALPCAPRVGETYASSARHPDGVVENRLDGLGVDAARVVLNDDRVLLDDDRDLGRDFGFLAGVEPVVDQAPWQITIGHS